MIKEVYLIFKTHLDIGYTDYAKNVIDNYLYNYIPNAIKVGYELKGSSTPFVWSVGSWLIDEAIKRGIDIEPAIKDGIISWHGLPYTSHTELMTKELFEYGVTISKKLDKKYGKNTIGAKMTDVPGHTIAMIPTLKKHGIEFLHIGVNTASPLPDVPPLFRWKYKDNYINVMYQKSYGTTMELGDFAVHFAHTNDNMGPQSSDEIVTVYKELREKYPNAIIKAGTLNDLALKIREIPDLPVVESEIGDTWIHGVATDPKKLSGYRQLLRNLKGKNLEDYDISDNLFLVPEHTWGMCIQKYFPDTDYSDEGFKKTEETGARKILEKSWEEQRDYVTRAEETTKTTAFEDITEPNPQNESAIFPLPFEFSWQIFDNSDYERYKKVYMQYDEENREWATWDYTKHGMYDYHGGTYTAKPTEYYAENQTKYVKLEFDEDIRHRFGLPYLWAEMTGNKIKVTWYGKKASRLPQAAWIKFTGLKEEWKISKMDEWIDPLDVVGSPLIMATDKGVTNGEVTIEPLDSALVAPFGRRLLDFEQKPKGQDMYFNLYNNIWNTNFPMWYSDDTYFRFIIK